MMKEEREDERIWRLTQTEEQGDTNRRARLFTRHLEELWHDLHETSRDNESKQHDAGHLLACSE